MTTVRCWLRYLTLRRLSSALSGWPGVVLGMLVVVSVVCLLFLPSDTHNRHLAGELRADGTPVLASDVEVYVSKEYGKGGPWFDVNDVRVRLPDRERLVVLQGTIGMTVDADDPPLGWQPPTAATGYDQDPFWVRLGTVDGHEVVMAQQDVDYYTIDNHDVRTDLALGLGALLTGLVWLIGCLAVDERRRRQRDLARAGTLRCPPTGSTGKGRHRI